MGLGEILNGCCCFEEGGGAIPTVSFGPPD